MTKQNKTDKPVVMNERANHLMKILVEKYIHDGSPIGSKALQESSGLNLSSATIRHIMSDLEKLGLLQSPHTSAGRIPTPQGYRLFVDKLISINPSSVQVNEDFNRTLLEHSLSADAVKQQSQSSLLKSTSNFLSDITKMASVVLCPSAKSLQLKHIEFLPLSKSRLLVIIVSSDGDVKNRFIEIKENYSTSQLQQMTNYLNSIFVGQSISALQQSLITEMEKTRGHIDKWMQQAINIAKNSLVNHDETNTENLICSGETNLIQYDDMNDMGKMRELFNAFHEKQKMIDMLHHVDSARDVQIYIGSESGYDAFSSCSLVAKSYQIDEGTVGVLGVIGPTRMAYNKIIPIVNITAKILNSAFHK